MTSITFIQKPAFIIDFSQYHSEKKEPPASFTQLEKIQNVVAFSLEGLAYFFIALSKSLYEEAKFINTSFKAIVLDKSGLSATSHPKESEFILAILYMGVWVLGMGFNVTLTTGRLWVQHFFPKKTENEVKHYIDNEINIDHIKTDDFALDTSNIPSEINIHLLANILNEINFDDPNAPGYMPPSTRKENDTIYTPEQLKNSLETFITNVKTRTPFLGTPASYDIPRLMAFYQQIEDAVRLSIHQIEQKMKAFKLKNGSHLSQYNLAQLNEYKGILEDRARIAIDIAIAGNHCGARYMGEAMSVYYSTVEDKLSDDKTLEKTLIEILAKKRKEIATEHIQMYLGNDTHAYANYMGRLGQALAIPGTKNIIEQLAHPLDTDKFKRLFFRAYTIDIIIETIQDQLKSSHFFREKVIDWLKEQISTWNDLSEHEVKNIKNSILNQINVIINQADTSDSDDVFATPLETLQDLLDTLKKNNVSLPSLDEGWDTFLENLLALNEVKIWCNENLPNVDPILSPITNVKKRTAFKMACFEAKLGTKFVGQLVEEIKEKNSFEKKHFQGYKISQKVNKIRAVFNTQKLPSPSDQTIQRIISGKTTAKEIVEGILDTIRKSNFINALSLDHVSTKGLSPELIEWILVSQKILLPQKQVIAKKITLDTQTTEFVSTLVKHFKTNPTHELFIQNWIKSLKTASFDKIEKDAKDILSAFHGAHSKRYQFEISNREKLLKIIFMNSYKNFSLEVPQTLLFPHLEEEPMHVNQIKILRFIGNMMNHSIFKSVASITAISVTLFAGYRMSYAILNQATKTSSIAALQSALIIFTIERSFSAALNTWKSCSYIGEYCKITASEFESEYLNTVREKIFPIWMGAML